MSGTVELPEDDWHTHVYVMLDATCCRDCGLDPQVNWAWESLTDDRDPADQFAVRVVEHLKRAGWQMAEGMILRCPTCAAKAAN